MVADNRMVFTQGAPVSNWSTMIDGAALAVVTTPSVVFPGGIGGDRQMAVEVFVPAFTNSNVGVTTTPIMTIALQGALGAPTTEANWTDVLAFPQLRPFVPGNSAAGGSTGAGTPANPLLSNRVVRRLAGPLPYTNYRLSFHYRGSRPQFFSFYAALRAGVRQPVDPA